MNLCFYVFSMCTVCISHFLWQCGSGSDDSNLMSGVWTAVLGHQLSLLKWSLCDFKWGYMKCWLKWVNIVLLLSVYVTVRERESVCVCVVFKQTDKNKYEYLENQLLYVFYWSLLYNAILCSRADSLRSHVILHEWIAFYSFYFYF